MTGLAHIKRNQLAMLAEACSASQPLTITSRTDGAEWQSRLCCLSDTELLAAYPRSGASRQLSPGTPVEGRFSYAGSAWAFFSTVQGRCDHPRLGALVRLSMPLMVQPGERRKSTRHIIDDEHPISARLTSVTDASRSFTASVIDLSDSGVGADVEAEHCELLNVGDLFWIEVQPAAGETCASFVVRLAHRGPCKAGQTRLGFEFQAGDNREAFERNLTRLEGLVRQCAVPGVNDDAASAGTGVSKC